MQKFIYVEMILTVGVKGKQFGSKQNCLHVLRKWISCQFSDVTPH